MALSRDTEVSPSGALVAKNGGGVISERCGGAGPRGAAAAGLQLTTSLAAAGMPALQLHAPASPGCPTPLPAEVGQALDTRGLGEVALWLAPSNVTALHSLTLQLPDGQGFAWHRVRWQGE